MQVDTSTLISIRVLETINSELRKQVAERQQEAQQQPVANFAMIALGALSSVTPLFFNWLS